MQYINVMVNTKTEKINQVFTYKVTPELLPGIKPGVLIEVPFGRKNKEGVILNIKRSVKFEIQHKLKSIKKIIDFVPIIDPIRLELAKWMAKYYMTSLGKVVFFMLPDVARKIAKQENSKTVKQYSNKVLERKSILHVTSCKLHDPKIFGLYNSKQIRIQNYIQLIQKSHAKNMGVILLFPDWVANKKYIDIIYERFKSNIVLLDPNKTKTEFFRSWNELRSGDKNIVIGTRNSIFAPSKNLGLIIIDEIENFAYKEEQIVHYRVREVAAWLTKFTGANLIYGSNILQLSDYYSQKFGKMKLLQHSNILKNVRMFNKIQLINSSQEKTTIGYQIEQKISQALKNKQRVLFFANRKNQGFLCADCGFIFRCPRCNTSLQLSVNSLSCSQCNYLNKLVSTCQKCQGHNLQSFGYSVESIKKDLQKLFPQEKVTTICSHPERTKGIKRFHRDSSFSFRMTNIIIATKEIFRYPNIKFDLVVIPLWQQMQFEGDFDQNQDIINTIVKLLEIGDKKLIIQVDNLEDEFLQKFMKGSLSDIYEGELSERKKYHYPPFYKLVKFIYKHKIPKNSEKEINKLYRKLKEIPQFTSLSQSNDMIKILGPTKTIKLRDKYYWQLVLKIHTNIYPQVNKLLTDNEHELQLSRYLVDVDPLQLI